MKWVYNSQGDFYCLYIDMITFATCKWLGKQPDLKDLLMMDVRKEMTSQHSFTTGGHHAHWFIVYWWRPSVHLQMLGIILTNISRYPVGAAGSQFLFRRFRISFRQAVKSWVCCSVVGRPGKDVWCECTGLVVPVIATVWYTRVCQYRGISFLWLKGG